jgi:hypothetical protein
MRLWGCFYPNFRPFPKKHNLRPSVIRKHAIFKEMTGEIINRVALSPLVTIDLEDFWDGSDRVTFDLKEWLFMGMILREKDFRERVEQQDWSAFSGKHVNITCSVDAVVPMWAYMIVGIHLEPFAKTVVFGSTKELETEIYRKTFETMDFGQWAGKKIVVKGCGNKNLPESVYVEFIRRLRPIADKLMFGEPCSTVPLYKKAK